MSSFSEKVMKSLKLLTSRMSKLETSNIKNETVKIFSGTINEGSSATVTEAITNFRYLLIRTGNTATYIQVPVLINSSVLRGINTYTANTQLEIFSVVATHSNKGMTFNLERTGNWAIKESGNVNAHGYTNVTEIYGIR